MKLSQKHKTPQMFNRIAFRYDLLNHLLSVGQHNVWRNKLSAKIQNGKELRALDLATGTGDQIISLLRTKKISAIIGLDPSVEMLTIGEGKIAKQFPQSDVTLVEARAEEIPFQDAEFDLVSMSFGIRNVPSVQKVLTEAWRVLKPGGRLLILEASTPKNRIFKALNKLYLTVFVSKIAGMLAGNNEAYEYLNESIKMFPSGEAFLEKLKKAGFNNVTMKPMMFGSVTIYQADKI